MNGRQFIFVIAAQAVISLSIVGACITLAATGRLTSDGAIGLLGAVLGLAGGIGGAAAGAAGAKPGSGTTHVPNEPNSDVIITQPREPNH